MALIRHFTEKSVDILFVHKVVEVVASALPCQYVPPRSECDRQNCQPEHLEQGREEGVAAQQSEYADSEAGQKCSDRAFCECGASEQYYHGEVQEAFALRAVFAYVIHYIYGTHHTCGEHHVDAAGYRGAEYLERACRDKRENHGEACAVGAPCPCEAAHSHGECRESRRKARYILVYHAAVQKPCQRCYYPCHERRFVGHILSVAQRQYPVAAL